MYPPYFNNPQISMKANCFVFLFICTVFSACSRKHVGEENFIRIDASYSDNMTLNLSDFAESVEFIPLQTNDDCLLARLTKIQYVNNNYYIVTGVMSTNDRILVFDKDGTFLYKLDKRGQGPDEYADIRDFDVMDNSHVIVVSGDAKFLIYNIEQNVCLIHKRWDYSPLKTIFINDRILLYNSGVTTHTSDAGFGPASDIFIEYDTEGNMIDSYYSPNKVFRKKIRYVLPVQSFLSTGDQRYFKYSFCDTIFEIKNRALIPAYYLDFGNRKVPEKIFKDDNINGILDIAGAIKKNGGIFDTRYFSITPDYVYFYFNDSERNNYYIAFFNPANAQTIKGNQIVDDIFFKGNKYLLKDAPKNMDGEDLLWPVEAFDFINAYKSYKQRATKEEWDEFCSKHANIVAICEKLKEDDNPVLLRIKVKLK